ncbi:MAG: hypothetical protein BWY72_02239 [Bacteroidetes bacterium ADurb.Bin416]|nr:MAG: hypothetical protein BWY72_02239 [Bacteroidetes bacterium ADurb.Bin416]
MKTITQQRAFGHINQVSVEIIVGQASHTCFYQGLILAIGRRNSAKNKRQLGIINAGFCRQVVTNVINKGFQIGVIRFGVAIVAFALMPQKGIDGVPSFQVGEGLVNGGINGLGQGEQERLASLFNGNGFCQPVWIGRPVTTFG